MSERLFLFIQLEFPWELGPPDGRYLLRTRERLDRRAGIESESESGAEPEQVVVLNTLGARRRAAAVAGWKMITLPGADYRARRPRRTTPDPAPVPTARATIIDPVTVSAKRQAQVWLAGIDTERETLTATAVLNRVLYAHRIATADPHTHAVSPAQALVIRAGWGEGKQVAEGHWQHARELPWVLSARAKRRAAVLRPDERLAELLGARTEELLCEELALRARLDLDHGRLPLAAIDLDAALTAALSELDKEANPALAPRLDELRTLHDGMTDEAEPDEKTLRHALERLEAALRARTAWGLTRG